MNTVRSGVAPRQPQKPQGLFTFTLSAKFLQYVDLAAWSLWAIAQTFFPLSSSAVRYLLVAYFAGNLVLRYGTFVGPIVRCWPMFLLPILAIISSIWAPSASEAIRKSLLLTLTALIGIYVARQLTARQIIYSIFAVNFLAALASAAALDVQGGGATGVFSQKNVLALSMFFLMSSGMVLIFDRAAHWALRLMAVSAMPLALWLMLQAASATILILSIPMTTALAVQVLMWGGMRRIRHLRSLMALFALFLVALVVMLLFGISDFDAVSALLGSVNKDTTLTGRTIIWAQAERILAEHPWTGLGAEGFWRPEVGEANSILRFFHYTAFTKFSFHNSYLENGVQFGYPGMIATYFLSAWCVYRAVRTWILRQDLHNAFFMFLSLMILARSFTESDLGTELGWTFILMYICAARENPKTVARRAPAPPLTAAAPTTGGPGRAHHSARS